MRRIGGIPFVKNLTSFASTGMEGYLINYNSVGFKPTASGFLPKLVLCQGFLERKILNKTSFFYVPIWVQFD